MNIILHGDFRDIIKNIRRDYIVITDPPYNIKFKGYKEEYRDDMSDGGYIEMLSLLKDKPAAIINYPEEMMKYVVPALGIPNKVLCWCYNSNFPRRFRLINIYNCHPDFSKVLQPYKNPNDKRIKKHIQKTGSKGTPIYEWFSDIQQVKNVSSEKTDHPCPIPVNLAKRLILLLTRKGDLVLDPFCGGGTVCLAAKQLGRNYIGIDISSKYCEISAKRIAAISGKPLPVTKSMETSRATTDSTGDKCRRPKDNLSHVSEHRQSIINAASAALRRNQK